MQYTRVYADDAGESHFEDVTVEFQDVNYAPPAPPVGISEMVKATNTGFMRVSPKRGGEVWHPSPVRQFMVIVSGRVEVLVGDGDRREFSSGDVFLVEDTHGKGHAAKTLDGEDALIAVIQLD